jgi:hypothetical protein
MSVRYARVWLPGKRPVILQITHETAVLLDGIEVNDQGEEIVPAGRNANGERRHIIAKDTIVRCVPLVMDNTYATLRGMA